ncbi:MAG: hypothetical protein K9W42_06940 [Candidatus Heimdallarchaeota archaeon]|nr:hypothetical protein [Candidatus Heimdallarchaeota archaeon]
MIEGLLFGMILMNLLMLLLLVTNFTMQKKQKQQSLNEKSQRHKDIAPSKVDPETEKTFNPFFLYSVVIVVFLMLVFFLFFSYPVLHVEEGGSQPKWPFFLFVLLLLGFSIFAVDFYKIRSKRVHQKEMRKL